MDVVRTAGAKIFRMIGIVFLCVLTFTVLLAATVVFRLTTGQWLGVKGGRRVETGLSLLLVAALAGVTFWYS